MKLEDQLIGVSERQFAVLHELRRVYAEVVGARTRLQLRIAEFEQQEVEAAAHYEQAVAQHDPQAELIRDWPERAHARAETLGRMLPELEAAEKLVQDQIRSAEQGLEDFRLLRPLLVARVAAARSAGLGREVFETLNDALHYIDLTLDAAEAENPKAPGKGAAAGPASEFMASAESHFASGAEDLAQAQAAIMAETTSRMGFTEQSTPADATRQPGARKRTVHREEPHSDEHSPDEPR